MNQEIKLEIKNNGTWENYISTYSENSLVKIKPYICVSLTLASNTPQTASIAIANPPIELLDLTTNGTQFRISMGYSAMNDGSMDYTKIQPVFVGTISSTRQPYFQEAGAGADQIFVINLVTYQTIKLSSQAQYEANVTLDSVLSGIFEDMTIEYNPDTLSTTKLKTPISLKPDTPIQTLQKHFEKIEGIKIDQKADKIIVSKVGTKESTANTTVIYNKALGDTTANIAPTMIKTKYAYSVTNLYEIELACVVPQVMAYNYVSIENIGTNLSIYNASAQNYTTFYVQQQQVMFGSFGESMHKLLLAGTP